jgi:hypothetical protein
MNWTTKMSEVAPEMLAGYGVMELHVAYFAPVNFPGRGPAVTLGIPECELLVVLLRSDGEPLVFLNRPQTNFKIEDWIKSACRQAIDHHAVISFNCDTLEQLKQAVALAQNLLPQYERVALERMKNPETRSKMGLS